MKLEEIMQEFSAIRGIVLGDTEGLLEQSRGDVDAPATAAHSSFVMSLLRNCGGNFGLGEPHRFEVVGDRNAKIGLAHHDGLVTVHLMSGPRRDDIVERLRSAMQSEPATRPDARPEAATVPVQAAAPDSFPPGPAVLRQDLAIRLAEAIISESVDDIRRVYDSLSAYLEANGGSPDGLSALGCVVDDLVAGRDFEAANVIHALLERQDALPTILICVGHLLGLETSYRSGMLESAERHGNATLSTAPPGSSLQAHARVRMLELAALGTRGDAVLHQLNEAVGEYVRVMLPRTAALASMLEARLRAAGGEIDASIRSARSALQLDRRWPIPIFFLADQALECGQPAQATALLDSILSQHGGNKQLCLRRSAYHAVATEQLAIESALTWLALVDSPPTPRVIGAMDDLATANPELAFMNDAVRWSLLRSGGGDDSELISPPGQADAVEVQSWAAGPSASFAGDLRLFPVPNLLEFLRSGHCSGVLVCHGPQFAAGIQLKSGRIVGVIAPTRANLGAAVVMAGLLSAGEGEQMRLGLPGGVSDRRIAQYLFSGNHLEPAVIREHMLRQIYGLVRQLLGWSEGHFSFDPEAPYEGIDEQLEIDLDPQNVLLSVCAEIDEAAG